MEDERSLVAEAAALAAFGPACAAEVVAVRPKEGVLVLEEVVPGTPLAHASTERGAAEAVGDLLRSGWPPPTDEAPFHPMEEWASLLRGEPAGVASPEPGTVRRIRAAVPTHLLDHARRILVELESDAAPERVLHGDLHWDNVLECERRGFVLVDPKGFVGEPAFDLGYLVSRPGPLARDGLPARRAVSVRLAVLCERTGLDRARVLRWAYVAAVLSGLWELEDRRDGWAAALEMARIVALDL